MAGLRTVLAAIGVACAIAPSSSARAQSALSVRTLEHGDWAASIATMQSDPAWLGQTIHVVVEDAHGARSACGTYQLALDPSGQRALALGACDGASGATALQLVDRAALFGHGDIVARPLAIGIDARETRQGAARGGAAQPAGAELECSIAVRPYLVDLLTGARVRATPDRFELQPIGEGARVEAVGDGWSVRAGSVRVEYRIVDRRTGDVVLHDSAELACGTDLALAASPAAAAASADVIALHPHRAFRGATLTRGADDHGSCGGIAGPQQWYEVRLDAPTHLGLRLVSEFDATLYVREGAIDGNEIACRDGGARLETLEINLSPGTYYVAVDGTGTDGRYRLVSFEEPIDPRAQVAIPRAELAWGGAVESEIVPAPSRYAASCGGEQAPEHVYSMRLDAPSLVAISLSSRFDAALYLVDAEGVELECASALGHPGDTREPRVTVELPAGLYYVMVDGEGSRAGTGRYRLSALRAPLR